MHPPKSTAVVLTLIGTLFLGAPASAQWSPDPTTNLPVAQGAGDQVQAKLAPTPDGGCWLSWFDGIGTGYDVRLQRLGANGKELLPPGGVLVADRNFSSTQDYGLDVTPEGSALLVFRDDRPGGIQITAAKIHADGTQVFGPLGVQLTATTSFVAAPKIAGTSDHGAIVAWTQDSSVHVQRLSSSGTLQWFLPADLILTPGGGSYSVSDLHDDGLGAVLSFVHQTGGFGSPRQLRAQRVDVGGALLWGAAHVPVFDTGSLQFGNFPSFVPDGGGGGVFAWYDASSSLLQCYVQHILPDGSEAFPHNGVAVSTDTTRVRVTPSAAYDARAGETRVFWREQSSSQSMNGVYGQKLDAAGNRLWGNAGSVLVPLVADEITQVGQAPTGQGTLVFWDRAPGFGQDQLFGARVDAAGAIDVGPFDVSSTPSGKSRLAVAPSDRGFALLAWTDDRADPGDLLAQDVTGDGGLGLVGTLSCFGVGCPCGNDDPAAGCANSSGSGAFLAGVGTTSATADDLVLSMTGLPAFANGLLFMGDATVAALPFGDGLRCVGGSTWRWTPQNAGLAGTYTYGPGLVATSLAGHPPAFQLLPGTTWHFQAWYRDPLGPCGATYNLSSGTTVVFTP